MKTENSCKTAAVMGLLSRGPSAPAPAEGGVPAAQERTIEEITADILRAQQTGGEALLIIGNGLIEAKAKLNHGEWLDWLGESVNYSPRTAQKLMKLAREWTNANALAHLGAAKAFSLLVLSEEERESFMAENHLVDGEEKNVIDMSTRQLEQALRDREQALADKAAAEAARAKMAEDMTMVKGLLETAQEERDKALEEVDARQSALRAAEERTARLSGELEELRSRPVEVAVQVDQEAVDKARADGEARAEKEYKKARAEAQRQVSEANAAAAQVKTELQQKQREVDDLRFELKRAQEAKSSPVSADAELAQFKLLFEQAQGLVNQMRGLLLKFRSREDGEAAGKLAAALKALAENVGRCAE